MALTATTLDLLFHACLLALSYSGRHERTTVCTMLLCAGPIEGCSAVLAVRTVDNAAAAFELGLCVPRRKAS